MQALIHAIATVQVRIQTNGPLYANSELQTRYGLIDLILRALEWDVTNPDEVQVEYPVTRNEKADMSCYVTASRLW
jgi:predicted type IV restriction endonuclease